MLLVWLCFVLAFDVGQLLALYFSLVAFFIRISIGCTGALSLSLNGINKVMMMMMIFVRPDSSKTSALYKSCTYLLYKFKLICKQGRLS